MAAAVLLFTIVHHPAHCAVNYYYDHITANNTNAFLYPQDKINSSDGSTGLRFQNDGNLVLRLGGVSIWSSVTDSHAEGGRVILKYGNGNLVIRDKDDDTVWDSGTGDLNRENNIYHLVVIKECAFVLHQHTNGSLYSLWDTESDKPDRESNCSVMSSYSLPTVAPTQAPTSQPARSPTLLPTSFPTPSPTLNPTFPTHNPTQYPITSSPTTVPTTQPTSNPTLNPSSSPTQAPSNSPSAQPSTSPSGGMDLCIMYSNSLCTVVYTQSQQKIQHNSPAQIQLLYLQFIQLLPLHPRIQRKHRVYTQPLTQQAFQL